MLSALWTWFFGQRPEREIVKLSAIPTWTELFSDNRQELEITLANGEEFACDPELNCKVSMYQGNITCLEVDGIVRSTNETLDAHGGVSGAVSEAAGPNLMKEIKTLNGCRTGKVKTTAGFLLPSKYIIHTVGPNGENRPLLESCYKECLKEMTVKPMRSLAFCCISAGNANYPIDSAVIVAVRTVREWLEDRKRERKLPEIDRIIFCLYSDMDTALYNHWMQVFFPCPLEQVVPSTSDDQTVPSDLTKLTTSLDSEERILRPLPGFIEISYEPCMVCFDDDPSKARSKMPCGHVIGPHCMAEYCKGQIDQGRSKFVCSALDCKREWEYFLVRHVACLTQDEMQNVEKKLAEMNFVEKTRNSKDVPDVRPFVIVSRGQKTGFAVLLVLLMAKITISVGFVSKNGKVASSPFPVVTKGADRMTDSMCLQHVQQRPSISARSVRQRADVQVAECLSNIRQNVHIWNAPNAVDTVSASSVLSPRSMVIGSANRTLDLANLFHVRTVYPEYSDCLKLST